MFGGLSCGFARLPKRLGAAVPDEGGGAAFELWVLRLLKRLMDGAADVEDPPCFPVLVNTLVTGAGAVDADELGGLD